MCYGHSICYVSFLFLFRFCVTFLAEMGQLQRLKALKSKQARCIRSTGSSCGCHGVFLILVKYLSYVHAFIRRLLSLLLLLSSSSATIPVASFFLLFFVYVVLTPSKTVMFHSDLCFVTFLRVLASCYIFWCWPRGYVALAFVVQWVLDLEYNHIILLFFSCYGFCKDATGAGLAYSLINTMLDEVNERRQFIGSGAWIAGGRTKHHEELYLPELYLVCVIAAAFLSSILFCVTAVVAFHNYLLRRFCVCFRSAVTIDENMPRSQSNE